MIGVVGDFHIPDRASKIPDWVLKNLEGVDFILCTGDLTEFSVLYSLERIADVYCVRGNMDSLNLEKYKTIDVNGYRILLIHGHQVHPRGDICQLHTLGRSAGADIVVYGHTHTPSFTFYSGIYFLNPGSATGSWGGSGEGFPEAMAFLEVGDSVSAQIVVRKKQ